jgi:hypothetical protein
MNSDRRLINILVIFISLYFASFRWPLESVRLTSTFGESRGDHLHDGIDIVSYDTRVYPIEDAVVLYSWNRSFFPFENYSGSGNYMVLDHGEYASIYLHLDDSLVLQSNYTKDQPLGRFANTGRSYGAHIHYGVYNRMNWNSVNFFELVDPLEDTQPPVIDHMAFYIDKKYIRINDNSNVRLTKSHPLLIKVYDTIKSGDHFGVYKLTAFSNGSKIREVTIDGAILTDNQVIISGIPFNELYHGTYIRLPIDNYQNGENRFQIVASDFAGNQTQRTFTLNIKREY